MLRIVFTEKNCSSRRHQKQQHHKKNKLKTYENEAFEKKELREKMYKQPQTPFHFIYLIQTLTHIQLDGFHSITLLSKATAILEILLYKHFARTVNLKTVSFNQA